jgi:hypothetical protein
MRKQVDVRSRDGHTAGRGHGRANRRDEPDRDDPEVVQRKEDDEPGDTRDRA